MYIKPANSCPLLLSCLYICSTDQTVVSQMQITLSRLTEQGTEVLQRFRVYCDISRGVRGGTGLTLHSGIKLRNSLESWLAVGVYQNWPGNAERHEPDCIQVCAVLCCAVPSCAVLCCAVCWAFWLTPSVSPALYMPDIYMRTMQEQGCA